VAILNPILIGTDGVNKMSKSLGNTIAVDDPPNEKFGKVMSIPDGIIANYYEFATSSSLEELADVRRKLDEKSVNPRDLKFELARRIVARFHGDDAARAAGAEFERVFKQKELPDDMPEVVIGPKNLDDGRIWIVRLIVAADMAKTNGEARRLIEGGGVRLNDERVADVNLQWAPVDGTVLQVGKRRFARIVVQR
jgi:tyrosyl-tRNA synthetase